MSRKTKKKVVAGLVSAGCYGRVWGVLNLFVALWGEDFVQMGSRSWPRAVVCKAR